jgi:hypothetical protein
VRPATSPPPLLMQARAMHQRWRCWRPGATPRRRSRVVRGMPRWMWRASPRPHQPRSGWRWSLALGEQATSHTARHTRDTCSCLCARVDAAARATHTRDAHSQPTMRALTHACGLCAAAASRGRRRCCCCRWSSLVARYGWWQRQQWWPVCCVAPSGVCCRCRPVASTRRRGRARVGRGGQSAGGAQSMCDHHRPGRERCKSRNPTPCYFAFARSDHWRAAQWKCGGLGPHNHMLLTSTEPGCVSART